MSRPNFFYVPKSVKDNIDTEFSNKLYKGSWIYPSFVDRFLFDIDMWKEIDDQDLTYFNSIEQKYNSIVNANWLAKEFIPNLMKSKYDAEWDNTSVGREHGVNIKAYYSYADNCYYVYTMNRWKRSSSWYKNEMGKCYFICIYKIPAEMFYNIYGEQNKYEFYISQYPTGIKFDVLNDTEKSVYQQEMNDNWDYGTNIRSSAWPFMQPWWKRKNIQK